MENLAARSWLRRVPVLLSAVLLAGMIAGLLLCHLALSRCAVKALSTQPIDQIVLTTSEEPGLSGDLCSAIGVTFTPVATICLPMVSRVSRAGGWALWIGPTQLRGANVYQRCVYPELDGPDFFGPGPVGPPYTQADFDGLAAMGANYVNISYPGLFAEDPPTPWIRVSPVPATLWTTRWTCSSSVA